MSAGYSEQMRRLNRSVNECPWCGGKFDLVRCYTLCKSFCRGRCRRRPSQVFAGQTVGIKQTDDRIWLVSFMDYDLGYFDLEQKTLQPLDNPFGTTLVKQCSSYMGRTTPPGWRRVAASSQFNRPFEPTSSRKPAEALRQDVQIQWVLYRIHRTPRREP